MNLPPAIEYAMTGMLAITVIAIGFAVYMAFEASRQWNRAKLAQIIADEADAKRAEAAKTSARMIRDANDRLDKLEDEYVSLKNTLTTTKGVVTKQRKQIEELKASDAGTAA